MCGAANKIPNGDSETNAECATVTFSPSGMLLSLHRDLQLIHPEITIEFSDSTIFFCAKWNRTDFSLKQSETGYVVENLSVIRNVPSHFPNECSAFENLSVKRNVPSNFPLDWTLFIKESGNDARKQMVH